jgi:hypothetical protein
MIDFVKDIHGRLSYERLSFCEGYDFDMCEAATFSLSEFGIPFVRM